MYFIFLTDDYRVFVFVDAHKYVFFVSTKFRIRPNNLKNNEI